MNLSCIYCGDKVLDGMRECYLCKVRVQDELLDFYQEALNMALAKLAELRHQLSIEKKNRQQIQDKLAATQESLRVFFRE